MNCVKNLKEDILNLLIESWFNVFLTIFFIPEMIFDQFFWSDICFSSFRSSWKQPGQYIHAKPFSHEDYPNYDMDEEDLRFMFFYIYSLMNIEYQVIVVLRVRLAQPGKGAA